MRSMVEGAGRREALHVCEQSEGRHITSPEQLARSSGPLHRPPGGPPPPLSAVPSLTWWKFG